jgi:hypothetical protein
MAAAPLNSANQSRIWIFVSAGFLSPQNWRATVMIVPIRTIRFLISSVIRFGCCIVAFSCHVRNAASAALVQSAADRGSVWRAVGRKSAPESSVAYPPTTAGVGQRIEAIQTATEAARGQRGFVRNLSGNRVADWRFGVVLPMKMRIRSLRGSNPQPPP